MSRPQREKHRSVINDQLGRAAGNGHRVLEHLYQQPIVSVHQVQALIGTTYAAANQLVARLATEGLLREITGHSRNRQFQYQQYVDLFSDQLAAG